MRQGLIHGSLHVSLLARYEFTDHMRQQADALDGHFETIKLLVMVHSLPRSPEIMLPLDTGLLVVDLQGRLLAVQPGHDRLVWNVRRLIEGAKVLGVRIAVTEQCPEKIGPTTPQLDSALGLSSSSDIPVHSKEAFSSGECGALFANWRELGICRVLLCGIETHVCVQQTALDLLAEGYQVQVAVDAVSSRFSINHDVGLRRLELSGALLTTVEGALFEWCGRAGTPQFKKISSLVKEIGPE